MQEFSGVDTEASYIILHSTSVQADQPVLPFFDLENQMKQQIISEASEDA